LFQFLNDIFYCIYLLR